MRAAILCGGRGTRLREVSETLPKPMVRIGDKPVIWHIMKIYASHGIKDFVLLLGYKGDIIRDYFLGYYAKQVPVTVDLSSSGSERLTFHGNQTEDWRVTLVDTGDAAMTGARVRRARDFLGDDTFCLTYGDGVGDVNITSLVDFHRDHGRTATLTGVYPPGRFGDLAVSEGAVQSFNEKPQVSGGHINGGFFVMNANFIDDYLDDREDLVLEVDPMKRLTEKQDLMMFPHNGFWQPMDTPREHKLLNDLWASGRAPWKTW
ncbi:glucose-1-phosphate cytidylyltransferase [Mameliella alba]|uniref:Glucose-1-phosphate cytidylyltransferase n=1 Tax=Mameliella alba TaxID=561184 RepID=A0A0B3RG16_9RHOB|nr:glucose-1-phosphate cytidylyltransferase [Mameliella alba]KHQ50175.1 Glucose-1-phosphate cytidylyltransferase [Mameliella alba]